jgi:hypothetical protein
MNEAGVMASYPGREYATRRGTAARFLVVAIWCALERATMPISSAWGDGCGRPVDFCCDMARPRHAEQLEGMNGCATTT